MSLISLKGMVTRGAGVSTEPEARVSGFRRVSAPLEFGAAPTLRIAVHPQSSGKNT